MKDNNGTRRACSGAMATAAGLLVLAACAGAPPGPAPEAGSGAVARTFPLLTRAYPGLLGDDDPSAFLVDETGAGTEPVFYYAYTRSSFSGWPPAFAFFPNTAFAPYGYFGYPYRYRPYGTYPRRGSSGRGTGWSDGGWPPPPVLAGERSGGIPQIGPQSAAVGPQPAAVGQQPFVSRIWKPARTR